MLVKITLAAACLCLVQAALINKASGDIHDENNVPAELSNYVENVRSGNFEVADDFNVVQTASKEGSPSARSCTNSLCNTFCRSRGYLWGHCVGVNICRCYRFVLAANENESPSDAKFKIENNNEDANAVDKFSDDFSIGESAPEDGSPSVRSCTNSLCNTFCRSRGYLWGHCVGVNICRCYRFVLAANENDTPSDVEVKIFNKSEKAEAVNAEKSAFTEDFSIGESAPEEGSPSARSCTNAVCNSLCRSLGFVWGHCVSANVCRCYR